MLGAEDGPGLGAVALDQGHERAARVAVPAQRPVPQPVGVPIAEVHELEHLAVEQLVQPLHVPAMDGVVVVHPARHEEGRRVAPVPDGGHDRRLRPGAGREVEHPRLRAAGGQDPPASSGTAVASARRATEAR